MSPEMAQQMGISPEQAKQMSDQLGNMDPATLEKMMKWSMRAQSAWQTVKSRKFWFQAMICLLIALVIGHVTESF